MARVDVVVCARDEEPRLGETLERLKSQTAPPSDIIVVDDGSLDATGEIARRLGCRVVTLPRHPESLLGLPGLAKVFNAGLAEVDPSADYVMLLGADHRLPPDYLDRLVKYMDSHKGVALASGVITGEKGEPDIPRNSGMLARTDFWRRLNGLRYPVCWGYEAWLIFKAQQLGYNTVALPEITSATSRGTVSKGERDGMAMYALGYPFLYALGRSVRVGLRSPADGLRLIRGFLFHPGVQKLDIADFVARIQSKRIWNRFVLRREV